MVDLADTDGTLIVEAVSQALTARSVAYATLAVFCCFWMRLGGDAFRGLNPTDVSAWDRAPGGHLHTLYNLHTVIYKTGSFLEKDHNI